MGSMLLSLIKFDAVCAKASDEEQVGGSLSEE